MCFCCCVFDTFSVFFPSVSLPVHGCRRVLGDVIHQSDMALIQLHGQWVVTVLIKQHAVVLISSHLLEDRNENAKLTLTPSMEQRNKQLDSAFNTWGLIVHINQNTYSTPILEWVAALKSHTGLERLMVHEV